MSYAGLTRVLSVLARSFFKNDRCKVGDGRGIYAAVAGGSASTE